MKNIILIFTFFLFGSFCYGQVGIGTMTPNRSSQLEIVSQNKGILIPRVSLISTLDTTTILNGNVESLLVYNISNESDLQIGYYFWSKGRWHRVLTDDVVSGKIKMVDNGNGTYSFTNSDGSVIVINSSVSKVANGLNYNGQTEELGGSLIKPTQIITTASNTLAIQGIQLGNVSDNIVVMDPNTGVLKFLPPSSLNNAFKVEIHTATENQNTFTTPFLITDKDKVEVFRNGIEIDFNATINTSIITLDFSNFNDDQISSCFSGDEIKIFQWK